LIKRFHITERVGADFRAEFFNIFNHAQFGLPNADLASGHNSLTGLANPLNPTLGQITYTVNNPRLIQFAIKVMF
jgi:hypothetical protein